MYLFQLRTNELLWVDDLNRGIIGHKYTQISEEEDIQVFLLEHSSCYSGKDSRCFPSGVSQYIVLCMWLMVMRQQGRLYRGLAAKTM